MLDRLVAGVLAPLAFWVLASGLDDLFLDLSAIYFKLKKACGRQPGPPVPAPEKGIALLIPAWREQDVIAQMLERNLAAIEYTNHEVFAGVYPNDPGTIAKVRAVAQRDPRVHAVVCPHDGPTSKADCLNSIYRGILAYEEERGVRFELILHHDAEDVIHPRSLDWINRYAEQYDMVQAPVLPLSTPCREWTHGTYCDDFAQSHLRDLHTRLALGGFLPSCGVGTAYRRSALDRLAWNNGGQVFQPGCLTEDYQIGLELHRLGCRQILLDAQELSEDGAPAATREYFPRRFRGAVRQRGRWVAGIALQSWEQIGWNAGRGQLYWLWRDRRGLLNNPLTIVANAIFLYGLAGWAWSQWTGAPWVLGEMVRDSAPLRWTLAANTGLIALRLAVRAACVRRVYGWRHALVSPLRTVWDNIINFAAWARALRLFTGARLRRETPAWAKTDHHYPASVQDGNGPRRLGEILVHTRLLEGPVVDQAIASLGPGERLGERLVRQGALNEFQLYTALALQQKLPFGRLDAEAVSPEALRRLPWNFARARRLIPVRRVGAGRLWLATPEVPDAETTRAVAQVTRLEPSFQLVTPSDYRRVSAELDRWLGAA